MGQEKDIHTHTHTHTYTYTHAHTPHDVSFFRILLRRGDGDAGLTTFLFTHSALMCTEGDGPILD